MWTIHVSFNLDAVDPFYTPGVSISVAGGLTYRESRFAPETIFETEMLRLMEFVELNPCADINGKIASLAVDLIQSALGKSIV